MSNTYPEGFDPNVPVEEIDYGPEYKKVETERNIYIALKKSLAKIGPVLEAFLRHEDNFKQKGNPNNEEHLSTHKNNIEKEVILSIIIVKKLADRPGRTETIY